MAVNTRLTYEDYCLLPNDGKRYEVIEGELFVTPPPIPRHQRAVTRLTTELASFVKNHRLGEVFVSPIDVVFSEYDVVEPDVVFISRARASIVKEKFISGAPDLVVEVISETTAKVDRAAKLKLYARFGVQEYWIIDPGNQSAEIYRLQESVKPARQLRAEDSLTSLLLPGFDLPLHELFE